MYWTKWGNRPKIQRAHMNGKNKEDLVDKNLGKPNGLALDHVYNKLYWVDAFQDTIESIEVKDLETDNRQVVLNKELTIRK